MRGKFWKKENQRAPLYQSGALSSNNPITIPFQERCKQGEQQVISCSFVKIVRPLFYPCSVLVHSLSLSLILLLFLLLQCCLTGSDNSWSLFICPIRKLRNREPQRHTRLDQKTYKRDPLLMPEFFLQQCTLTFKSQDYQYCNRKLEMIEDSGIELKLCLYLENCWKYCPLVSLLQ